ncbi:hypothetical protein PINS_up012523 [Pythium insidiosum]|nr:hypothetical protein PINS_up012523 [Pythium insidiosum]
MMDHLEDLKALPRTTHSRHAVELTAANGICSDSKVKLFFDSLLLHPTAAVAAAVPSSALLPSRASEPIVFTGEDPLSTGNSNGDRAASASAWRSILSAPLQLLSPISVDGAGPRTGGMFFHRALPPPPPRERQIELVDWSPRPVAPTRPRRRSSYEPREFGWGDYEVEDDEEEEEDEEEQDDGRRMQTRRRRRRASLANAEVSQQLMERKVSALELPSQYVELQAHHSDDTLSESSRTFLVAPMATTAKTTNVHPTVDRNERERELNALRAENEEQRELLRRLLAENRRLSHALKRCQCSDAAALADRQPPKHQTASVRPERSDCGVHETMSASPTLKPRAPVRPRRRSSLTLAVVDGEETLVDPKFDHLVSEIETVFASLLGNAHDSDDEQQQYSEQQREDELLLLSHARCQ